jgi:2-polyprenyl-3-methyl-5-hydroxy-6-metoxy-1,4-benzoquinol methylase
MIEIARKRVPDVDFRVMDVRRISEIGGKFDAIMCSFCLPFLSKEDSAKLIADCSIHLNPGGVVYFSTMEGNEDRAGFETTSFSGESEVYFNYHRQDDLEAALIENGFILNRIDRQEYLEPDGSITIDLIFIALRNE